MSVGKYNPVTYVPNEVKLACGINIYLMRLADVYLMYAEACFAMVTKVPHVSILIR